MVISLMAVSKTINAFKVNIGTEMETFTKVHGRMTSSRVLGNYISKMGKNTKEGSSRVKNMDKEFIHGKMVIDMKDSSHLISVKDWGSITGVMADFIRVSGKLTG